ncbi:unnamed protein product, partial [Prorocentrum cordatum]
MLSMGGGGARPPGGSGPGGRGQLARSPIAPFGGGVSKSERALVAGTDGSVAQVTASIQDAVQTYGPSPGAKKMMAAEQAAAEEAISTGLYGVWRNHSGRHDFCSRIGPRSRCFCGHDYSEHSWSRSRREPAPSCARCPCQCFRYVPRRPEEVGEGWLPRRRGFDVNIWRAKCKCQYGHDQHDPVTLACPGRGGKYTSAWQCVSCEGKWEDHESLWESEAERRAAGHPVGQAFMPLASTPGVREAVFREDGGGETLAALEAGQPRSYSLPHRPWPERSVRLMQAHCPNYGGASGSLEDAFPPRGGGRPPGGSLEDAFPPRGGGRPPGGSLEDAFPPRGGGRPPP